MEDPVRKLVEWTIARVGLKTNVLRPVPGYSMNPFYWLGALTAIGFLLQVFTGLLMLIFYVPTTDQAYSSTLYIINYVPLGWLIETVHLYGAYAMILLAFLHMFRGYFASVQKSPRELMWVIGIMMGFVVLGFGLTGYLLPWTVVSKSATDVSIGMLSFLPAQVGSIMTFLVAGNGSGTAELTRFFDLHIVVLPAILLVLLALKMFMFEAHGAAPPPTEETTDEAKEARDAREARKDYREYPWFPSVYLYFTMIGSAFLAVIIIASSLFPITLAAEFSPQAASSLVPQPEWYFLWIYQVIKFASFEGSGIYYALGAVSVLALGMILLPFLDRGHQRNPAHRPLYVTIGLILVAELLVLTMWGFFTPGQTIPDVQAITVMGEAALAVAIMSALTYRMRRKVRGESAKPSSPLRVMALPFTNRTLTLVFLLPLIVGSVAFANLVTTLSFGPSSTGQAIGDLFFLVASFYAMVRMVKAMTLAQRRPGI